MKFVRVLKASENKKYRIEVFYDDADYLWDDIQHNLSDNNIEIFSNLRNYKLADNEKRFEGKEELIEQGYDIRPIYAYIHSGIVLSLGRGGQFSDQFDSGLAGYAAVQGKFTPEQEKELEYYIKDFNELSEGSVYRYEIHENNEDDTVVEYMSGFMGYGDELANAIFENIPTEFGITIEEVKEAVENPRG